MRNMVVGPLLDAHVHAGSRVLDLGGFDGSVTEHLLARGAHVTLVDLDEDGVRQARARGLDGVVGSATEIPFPARSFDVVVCCDLLPCLPDELHEAVFREIARVLVPDGCAIMTIPDVALQLPFVDMAAAYTAWRSMKGMSRPRIDELTRRAGLEIFDGRAYFGLPARLFYALAFWHNLPARGTRVKRALWRYVVAGETYWCPAPQAHLIVGRPAAPTTAIRPV
jgi:SAM-dependent methyltransferase